MTVNNYISGYIKRGCGRSVEDIPAREKVVPI